MNRLNFYIILFILSGLKFCNAQDVVSNSQRQIIALNNNWEFHFAYDVSNNAVKNTVNLPNTWDAGIVTDGKRNYDREAGIYKKTILIPASWKDKRLFLYFEGVNSVASLFVNGHFITEHHGGYTAFCAEITHFVKPGCDNTILVQVSNAYRLDVLPLAGDFNVYGGIHRPVSLLVTSKNCISPVDYASPGVYLIQKKISARLAKITVLTKLSLLYKDALAIKTTIIDRNKKTVSVITTQLTEANIKEIKQDIILKKPNLWNGKADPYLYCVKVQLIRTHHVIDEVDQPLGLRYFKIDVNKGFLLNGKCLDLHGVGLHEDVAGKGSALTHSDEDRDMHLIHEIGATALRLTHYPHQQYFYNLCDTAGLIVWSEIPLVGPGGYSGEGYVKSAALEEQARQVLIEMIRQNYNHPSVCFWGLFNELKIDNDDPRPFLKQLNALAKKEDPTRLTTCATFVDSDVFNHVTDLVAWNKYYGWYGGNFDMLGKWADKIHRDYPKKPFAISEFGAGGSPLQHMENVTKPVATGRFHPEEWQSLFHEESWKQLNKRAFVWGKFVWSLADFGSAVRTEGFTNGLNDKGLVTYDRSVKKDAFYFYKANWNPEPMLYIAERRNARRTQAITEVKVYANVTSVTLVMNGKAMKEQHPDSLHIIRWRNIILKKGKNVITVIAQTPKGVLKDTCEWELL